MKTSILGKKITSIIKAISLSLIMVAILCIMPPTAASAATESGYVWPIEGQIFARGFSSTHEALDIQAGTGIAVKSINSGTVFCASMASTSATAGCSNCGHTGAGYHVAINHPNGIKAMYAHLSNVNVYVGQTVSAGQQIGNVGSTGNSTGPHLHLAMFLNGFTDSYAVDPLKYLTPFSNVYVNDITTTSATIHGVFGAYGPTMTSAGFYIGTSPSNLKKVTETLNTNGYDSSGKAITEIFYGTQKWYGSLKAGTTYYYKVWINRSGTEYTSDLKTFKTAGTHTHSWGSWSTTQAATCTVEGTQKRSCSCGASEMRSISASGHAYKEVEQTKATCLNFGSAKYQCSTCKDTYSITLSKLAHKYEKTYTVDLAPTCTTSGSKSYHCSLCDGFSKTGVVVIPATGHTFGEWKVTKEPTTASEGISTRTCSNCKTAETQTIAKLASDNHTHKFGSWKTSVVATCTKNGKEIRACSICNAEESRVVSASGQHTGEWKETASTCSQSGENTRICEECGKVEKVTTPALGHDYKEDKIIREPTATEIGLKQYKCNRCGSEKTEEIPFLLNTDTQSQPNDATDAIDNVQNESNKGILTNILIIIAICLFAMILAVGVIILIKLKKRG